MNKRDLMMLFLFFLWAINITIESKSYSRIMHSTLVLGHIGELLRNQLNESGYRNIAEMLICKDSSLDLIFKSRDKYF